MTLTDELLLAYADGLLDAARAADVEAALAQDAEARELLRLVRVSGAALEEARKFAPEGVAGASLEDFIRAYGEPAPDRAQQTAGPAPPRYRSAFWRFAAAAVLVVIGLAAGVVLAPFIGPAGQPPDDVPSWIARVADYHALYARSTVENVQMSDTERRTLEVGVENRLQLDHAIAVPDLTEIGLELKRGQILDYGGNWPIVQLVYLPRSSGEPMALCFHLKDQDDSDLAFLTYDGMGIVQWVQDGLEFVMVGRADREALFEAADLASLQF